MIHVLEALLDLWIAWLIRKGPNRQLRPQARLPRL
jgi:hypothetical protein